jgi:hypothetical protein
MEVKEIDFAEIPLKALNILTKPVEFFKSMHKSGGFLEPVIFAIIMGIVAGILCFFISIIGIRYSTGSFLGSLGLIIFIPLAVIIGKFHRCRYNVFDLETDGFAGKLRNFI